MYDIDYGGSISVSELKTVMHTLGKNPTHEEIVAMMKESDKDENLEIDL